MKYSKNCFDEMIESFDFHQLNNDIFIDKNEIIRKIKSKIDYSKVKEIKKIKVKKIEFSKYRFSGIIDKECLDIHLVFLYDFDNKKESIFVFINYDIKKNKVNNIIL